MATGAFKSLVKGDLLSVAPLDVGTNSEFQSGPPLIQNRPLGVEAGQYQIFCENILRTENK